MAGVLRSGSNGSDINGSWFSAAAGLNSLQYFASAVLDGGRAFVTAGEYNGSGQAPSRTSST
jgi:hypothetical protein